MKVERSQNPTIKDSEGKEKDEGVKKTIHDYTGEELDALHDSDPEAYEKLWSDAEIGAINDPENHNKSN